MFEAFFIPVGSWTFTVITFNEPRGSPLDVGFCSWRIVAEGEMEGDGPRMSVNPCRSEVIVS